MNSYNPIFNITEAKTKERLDSPLHLVGYLLDLYYYYYYKDDEVVRNSQLMEVTVTYMVNFFPDGYDTQNEVVNIELQNIGISTVHFGKKWMWLEEAKRCNFFIWYKVVFKLFDFLN